MSTLKKLWKSDEFLENDFIALRNHIRKFNKKVNRKIKIKKVLDKLNISVSLQS